MTKSHFKPFDETKAPHTFLVDAETVLRKRGKEYGHFLDLFDNTAKRMSMALKKKINPDDVARLMIELKLSRLDMGEYKEDTVLDIINYAALLGSLKFHMKDIEQPKKTIGSIDFSEVLNKTPGSND